MTVPRRSWAERFPIREVETTPRGVRATIEATIECEDVDGPVCVAELLVLAVS